MALFLLFSFSEYGPDAHCQLPCVFMKHQPAQSQLPLLINMDLPSASKPSSTSDPPTRGAISTGEERDRLVSVVFAFPPLVDDSFRDINIDTYTQFDSVDMKIHHYACQFTKKKRLRRVHRTWSTLARISVLYSACPVMAKILKTYFRISHVSSSRAIPTHFFAHI